MLPERKLSSAELDKLCPFSRHKKYRHGGSSISTGQDVAKPYKEGINACEDFVSAGAIGARKRTVDSNECSGSRRDNQNTPVDNRGVLSAYIRLNSD